MTLSSFVPLHQIDPDAARSLPADLELLVSSLTIDQIVARQFNLIDLLDEGEGSASPLQMREAADLVDAESNDR